MRNFKKTFHINAEPSDIYAALTNPYTIELWSGYPAVMVAKPGEEFNMWDGDICGKIIDLVPDRKVGSGVVLWRQGGALSGYHYHNRQRWRHGSGC